MTLKQWIQTYKNFNFEADQIENSKCPSFTKACKELKSILNKKLKPNNYEIVNFSPNWYECSFFVKSNNPEDKAPFCYVSFGDVRFWQNWADDVLIRTADHDRDYTGGPNNKCKMDELIEAAQLICQKGYYNSYMKDQIKTRGR